VRETKQERQKMKHLIHWTSHNEINENLELPAKVNRLKNHILILDILIAAMVGVGIVLLTISAATIWG
tara:strand:- start:3164 stop:3367 length:204 start_codon:yes stop_codon:yes gene_type:complete